MKKYLKKISNLKILGVGSLLNLTFIGVLTASLIIGFVSLKGTHGTSLQLNTMENLSSKVQSAMSIVKDKSEYAAKLSENASQKINGDMIKIIRTNVVDMKFLGKTLQNISNALGELSASDEEDAVMLIIELEDIYEHVRRESLPLMSRIIEQTISAQQVGNQVAVMMDTVRTEILGFSETAQKADQLSVSIKDYSKEAVSDSAATFTKLIITLLCIIIFVGSLVFYTKSYIIRSIKAISNRLKDIAAGEGDLTIRLEVKSEDELGDLAKWFNTFLEKLSAIIKHLKGSSKNIGKTAVHLSENSEEIAVGSHQQDSQLAEVSTVMEEMSSMIIESAANANMTKESAVSANEAVELGSKRVRDTISGISKIAEIILHTSEQMNQLEERSKKIGEVVDVIDDIADQTNLLALNANIEAARAGEAGRGFAVVADEVRKLAEKTVTATSEISTAIKLIQDDVRLAVKAMKTIEENSSAGQELATQSENALLQISDSILAVTEAIKQIAAATDEQSSGANQISKTIVNISSVSKQAASAAQLLANSSKELSNEVSALNNHIDQFQV